MRYQWSARTYYYLPNNTTNVINSTHNATLFFSNKTYNEYTNELSKTKPFLCVNTELSRLVAASWWELKILQVRMHTLQSIDSVYIEPMIGTVNWTAINL